MQRNACSGIVNPLAWMIMLRRVTMNELGEPLRRLLETLSEGEGLLVEDDAGRARFGVVPYVEATPDAQMAALGRLKSLQQRIGQTMQDTGQSEDDFDQMLQDKE
jgi:hypothetical protein